MDCNWRKITHLINFCIFFAAVALSLNQLGFVSSHVSIELEKF